MSGIGVNVWNAIDRRRPGNRPTDENFITDSPGNAAFDLASNGHFRINQSAELEKLVKEPFPKDDANKVTVAAGTVLLAEGTTSGRIYILDEGTLEVTRGETHIALVSEQGSIFGEMSLLLDCPHTASVRAVTPAIVYEFADGAEFLKSDPEATLAIARLLAQRLHSATTYLVDIKRQYAGHGTHLAMVGEVLASLINRRPREFLPGSDRQGDPGA